VRKTLLAAVNDSNSIFSHLRGTPHVLELIIRLATNELRWKKCIRVPNFDLDKEIVGSACGAATVELAEDEESLLFLTPLNGCEAGDHVDHDDRTTVVFPKPKDINVNMMPFILARRFQDCKLPDYLRPYWPLIERCTSREHFKAGSMYYGPHRSDLNDVCYLTVQESFVKSKETQRRPGLHVDCPGNIKLTTGKAKKDADGNAVTIKGNEGSGAAERFMLNHWGLGGCHFVPPQPHLQGEDKESYKRSFELRGGIYMASSVAESCRAWNCQIVPDNFREKEREKRWSEEEEEEDSADEEEEEEDEEEETEEAGGREVIGKHGSIEHMRHLLPEELAHTLEANRMYWMTDRTPHESLPLRRGAYRQFFRLVMSDVSLWYEDHSTPNPKGVKPDARITKIVRGNKFSIDGLEIVEN